MQFLEDENRFYVPNPDGGEDIGEITYTRIGNDKASIDHTYVNINYRGQGIADRLFDLVIELMKEEGRKVIPVCSYAIKQFELKPHLQSLKAEY
ncbi:GNAT family N-acetyltransferase [Orbus sturtevantii]|uniref:GNAT family N-acetyltransferase n=1 Tax=Orbus sturtevantii TaxID=3074109 RepID=UPI00370D5C77